MSATISPLVSESELSDGVRDVLLVRRKLRRTEEEMTAMGAESKEESRNATGRREGRFAGSRD